MCVCAWLRLTGTHCFRNCQGCRRTCNPHLPRLSLTLDYPRVAKHLVQPHRRKAKKSATHNVLFFFTEFAFWKMKNYKYFHKKYCKLYLSESKDVLIKNDLSKSLEVSGVITYHVYLMIPVVYWGSNDYQSSSQPVFSLLTDSKNKRFFLKKRCITLPVMQHAICQVTGN